MGVVCARRQILGWPMRISTGGVSLQTFPPQPEVKLQLACERVDDGGLTRLTRFGVSSSNISSSQGLSGFRLDALFLSFPCMRIEHQAWQTYCVGCRDGNLAFVVAAKHFVQHVPTQPNH